MESKAAQFYLVYSTFPSNYHPLPKLAEKLVTEKLAACVSILPALESVFFYQGQLCKEKEHLLLIKTTVSQFASLKKALLADHPYEVPEIIAVPLAEGHLPYLAWMSDATSPK